MAAAWIPAEDEHGASSQPTRLGLLPLLPRPVPRLLVAVLPASAASWVEGRAWPVRRWLDVGRGAKLLPMMFPPSTARTERTCGTAGSPRLHALPSAMPTTLTMPSLAWPWQNCRFLVPTTPNDGILVQPCCAHLLFKRCTIPSVACSPQNSTFLVPATPKIGRFEQPR